MALGGVLSVLLVLAGSQARAGIDSSIFTPEEWQRLDHGQLVSRSMTRKQGSLKLMGGSSWQVVNAPPDAVWRALLDTSRYHKMMPQVLEARLVDNKDNVRTVFLRQGQKGLAEARYYLKVHVHEDRRDLTFAIDDKKPHKLLRAAFGFYTVRPYPGDKTLLAYGVMADLEGGLLAGLMRGSVHEWMLRTPSLVKGFLEGSGRKLYR
jgi:hypothetical protein